MLIGQRSAPASPEVVATGVTRAVGCRRAHREAVVAVLHDEFGLPPGAATAWWWSSERARPVKGSPRQRGWEAMTQESWVSSP
ncbi:hypothetical protein OG756_02770 [Streptomyces sp. NBC_01310]|uniref:hypothetical protein n=1 Tax=Streptomyces sp. NBC_01310 TaxID=2903820 RepID=UPI0035B66B07|nr:hypothetical protein OG756_02770 [Streptomyces sp. NBC_01310]